MYQYDSFDKEFIRQRTQQFRDQVRRRLAGELTEEEFKPLRLMNGLYLQLHAYMLRVAIPYGVLSATQMHKLAHIARTYDKGYGHFTTRQNIQFNWPALSDTPDILEELAQVDMHAIQTSGNCIRNVTADPFAGVAADEIENPLPWCEILRQWSSLHPEFIFLPRKFKIAVSGALDDRAAVMYHDIGLYLRRNAQGEVGFKVVVGGGQGRTPMIAKVLREFLPKDALLSYMEAILRVYNMHGRRDNKYKARIKILVHALGIEEFHRQVEEEWISIKDHSYNLPAEEVARIDAFFRGPDYEEAPEIAPKNSTPPADHDAAFERWCVRNIHPHVQTGYAIVQISLKPTGGIPGDATATQMDVVADLAHRYSYDEIRITHRQNLILPHVRQRDLYAIYKALSIADLAHANIGTAGDIIACPGLDYCALANARSIPIAQDISERLARRPDLDDGTLLHLNISGCINACGHHHVGGIGILGVDRRGEEFYQITLGGSAFEDASVGEIVGPAFPAHAVADAVETILDTWQHTRTEKETFLETWRRAGIAPFKEALYGTH